MRSWTEKDRPKRENTTLIADEHERRKVCKTGRLWKEDMREGTSVFVCEALSEVHGGNAELPGQQSSGKTGHCGHSAQSKIGSKPEKSGSMRPQSPSVKEAIEL